MNDTALSTQFAILILLLVLSGFFAMAETAMTVTNRHRLRHMANEGHRGAQLALQLLSRIDRLISLILISNTLINAAAAMLTGNIALTLFGTEKWALEAGTLLITFCLLIFSEITPKVVGATYPDALAPRISYILTPIQRIGTPIVWFINLFVSALLKMARLEHKPDNATPSLSPEELRMMVLEAGHFIPQQHRTMLLNLFDLEHISVEDVMTPRGEIEAINLQDPLEDILQQLATSFHTRLPVYDHGIEKIIGILHQRRLLSGAISGNLDKTEIRARLTEPYFIPATTTIYAQLQFFRENHQRVGLIVDEYGEIQGLVTLEDIIEEIIGKFTTSMPSNQKLVWISGHPDNNDPDEIHSGNTTDSALIDGARSLREINRSLGLNFPLGGPKTLNGLILEHLQDIPESGLSVRINDIPLEIIQTQDRRIRMVRIFRPRPLSDQKDD